MDDSTQIRDLSEERKEIERMVASHPQASREYARRYFVVDVWVNGYKKEGHTNDS